MRMEFENGVLRIENAEGRQWQLPKVDKPRLSFPYDALSVTDEHALRRVGTSVQPLGIRELEEVAAFIARQAPPPKQDQIAADLKIFSYGLINTVVAQLKYDNLLDVVITGREGSTDLFAGEARQVLDYIDTVWNALHGLVAQIDQTPEAELLSFKDYANLLPMIPKPDHFQGGTRARAPTSSRTVALNGAAAAQPVSNGAHTSDEVNGMQAMETATAPAANGRASGRPVCLETGKPEGADFSTIVDRCFVFDDVFSSTQLHLIEQWALQTPHWMLSNSSHSKEGVAQHRIWGASFIESWRRNGWVGLPPVLLSMLATLFQRLDVTIPEPEYIGLNGQSKDQLASMHTDCEHDSPDELSILVYIGESTDGDLLLYDKDDRSHLLHRIAFKPNRVVAFDGSVPHRALAPTDGQFRMSFIIRGKYRVGYSDLMAAQGRT